MLEEVETGPKGGQSGPSTWRCLAADGEPVVEAGTGCRGGWVEELRGAAPELRDGSGWSERGWSRLSAVAQR
jgi:hypothetical protein